MKTQDELIDSIIDALEKIDLDKHQESVDKLGSYLYIADERISERIASLQELQNKINEFSCSSSSRQTYRIASGKVLEEIALLAFRGLKGASNFKSFQSAGPQYDLLVSGDNVKWLTVCKLLYTEPEQRSIVVEAKAKKTKLPDKDFARLCNIMELNLFKGTGLGVFFTLKGATGFSEDNNRRVRALRDARLRQVLFHAKTNKIIVVLDEADIYQLAKNGSFIKILTRKIRDLFELSGLPTAPVDAQEIDLPPHLKKL